MCVSGGKCLCHQPSSECFRSLQCCQGTSSSLLLWNRRDLVLLPTNLTPSSLSIPQPHFFPPSSSFALILIYTVPVFYRNFLPCPSELCRRSPVPSQACASPHLLLRQLLLRHRHVGRNRSRHRQRYLPSSHHQFHVALLHYFQLDRS
jgi:hypothetical protein